MKLKFNRLKKMDGGSESFWSFLVNEWYRETGQTSYQLKEAIQTGEVSSYDLDSFYDEWLDYREQFILQEFINGCYFY